MIGSLRPSGKIYIEFCTCDEWLARYGPYEGSEAAATVLTDRARELYEKHLHAVEEIPGLELVPSGGSRIRCEGWNEAQFKHRFGGRAFGTFDDVPAEISTLIEGALDRMSYPMATPMMVAQNNADTSLRDMIAPVVVEIQIRADRKVVWVNVDGVCSFRCCQIGELVIVDDSIALLPEQQEVKMDRILSDARNSLQQIKDELA